MAVTYPDTRALPVAAAVLQCLCDAAELNPKPPGQCGFRVGVTGEPLAGLAVDECCTGLAFVRVARTFPSNGVPAPKPTPVRCNLNWALELEIGIWRCSPLGTASRPPTQDEWDTLQADLLNDFATIRDVLCCVISQRDKDSVFVTEWAPKSDPEGGCVGTSVTIQMDLY